MSPTSEVDGLDFELSSDALAVVDAFEQALRRECSTERVRAAEPLGHDSDLWELLIAMGLLDIVQAPATDGGGLEVLAALAECFGRYLAPVPAIEAMVAVRLLAALGMAPITSANAIVTLALRPAVDGVATLVPAGAVADGLLALDEDELVLVRSSSTRTLVSNVASAPLADWGLRGSEVTRRVLATGAVAREMYSRALGEWHLLTASALAGMATRSLELGVAYVKERKQFGVHIGSFQSIAHRLADRATDVDGASLLSKEAAWAAEIGLDRWRALGLMALLFAAETAQRTSADSLHFHGGYGFMLEYDIQLFFRRSKGWPSVAGTPDELRDELAELLYGSG
jgi:hypothetical protein